MGEREAPMMELAMEFDLDESYGIVNTRCVGMEVEGQTLSVEESEAAAVLVACMRRGWGICWTPASDDGRWYVIDDRPGTANWDDHWGRTPSEAYARALAAMEEGATDGG